MNIDNCAKLVVDLLCHTKVGGPNLIVAAGYIEQGPSVTVDDIRHFHSAIVRSLAKRSANIDEFYIYHDRFAYLSRFRAKVSSNNIWTNMAKLTNIDELTVLLEYLWQQQYLGLLDNASLVNRCWCPDIAMPFIICGYSTHVIIDRGE